MRWQIEDTPERAAFRDQVRAFLRDVLPEGWLEAFDRGDDLAILGLRQQWDYAQWQKTLAESGYAAPLWPQEYGGLGGEPWQQQIVREELTRYGLPAIGLNILGVGLAGPTLIEHGNEEQKQRYLRKILSSEEIWCQLFSEPGAGSDLASAGTRAVRDGDDWVVNGQKVWTSIAQYSQFGMLLARTDPDLPKHDGMSYFIVDMRWPGVDIRPLKQITGHAEFNEVFLTDVRIPDSYRVGAVGDGWRIARTTLMNERVALSGLGEAGGSRKDPFQTFLETVPVRTGPLVRDRLAQLYIDQEVKSVTAFRAAAARAAGRSPGPEGSVSKVFNAELNQRRTEAAVDAAGLGGVAWMPDDKLAENRAHQFLRARANTIEGGTSEVLRNQIAERLLGLPREPDVDRGLAWSKTRR